MRLKVLAVGWFAVKDAATSPYRAVHTTQAEVVLPFAVIDVERVSYCLRFRVQGSFPCNLDPPGRLVRPLAVVCGGVCG